MSYCDIKHDNPSFRFDSEYFRKCFIDFYAKVKNISPLSDFVEDGYRVVYENTKVVVPEYAVKNNFPRFLQAADIETPYININNISYVDEADWERYTKGRVNRGEILIEVKGKIEKVALVPDDFPLKTLVSGSLYKMSLNNSINKYYILTYLTSKYGVAFKDRYKCNLLISFLSKDDLYRMPIPVLSKDLQNKIEETYTLALRYIKESLSMYDRAENALLTELELNDWQPTKETTTEKSFIDFLQSGRLDAEYYQPKYDEIEAKIKSYSNGYCVIADKFKQGKTISKFDKSEYSYIEIGDINISNGDINMSNVQTDDLPANAKLTIENGDILVSKVRPYRGAVAIVRSEEADIVASGAFTVLQEASDYKKEVLQVLLRTPIYKDWLLKFNVGSSYPVIKDDDVLNMPIPLLNEAKQQEITTKIQESFALRAESKRLLDLAKRAVEVAIEHGEDEGLRTISEGVINLYV